MDENHRDKVDNLIITEDVRWVISRRSKLWIPQHNRQRKANKPFFNRPLWDWLNLLGVLAIPFVVTFIGIYFTQQFTQQQAQSSAIANELQQREMTLQTYIDDMSDLLLNHHLGTAKPVDAVSEVARERTLTVLRRLDAAHNKFVVQFLQDAHLISGKNAVISLSNAYLIGDNLSDANLSGVDLSDANLSEADLSDADLSGATLSGAILFNAILFNANLRGANLSGAFLFNANLSGATLLGANLSGAFLRRANLSGVDLTDADLTDADLTDADLRGATMPDGSKHP